MHERKLSHHLLARIERVLVASSVAISHKNTVWNDICATFAWVELSSFSSQIANFR